VWFHEFRNRIRRLRLSIPDYFVQLTLPETCAGCGCIGFWICADCESQVQVLDSSGCSRCGRRGRRRRDCPHCSALFPTRLRRVRSGFRYAEPIRSAIQRFKYNGEYQRGYDLGNRLSERLDRLVPLDQVDVIVPIPLHPRRYRSRGFNQSEIIARVLGEYAGIPVDSPLVRIKNTSPQVRLTADERVENIRRAFAIDDTCRDRVPQTRFLLVDDVMTTGATIAAAATTLQEAGSGDLFGITVAREQ
jgi:ComF family protein